MIMEIVGEVVSTLGAGIGVTSFDDDLRILGGKATYLRAQIEDFAAENAQHGKKRMRDDDDEDLWLSQGLVLLDGAEKLFSQVGAARPSQRLEASDISFSVRAKVHKFVNELACHELKADMLSRISEPFAKLGLPRRVDHIPVKQLIGQSAMNALEQGRVLLRDDEVGNLAICGGEGSGKTIVMKHLYNWVLTLIERFDNAIWITCPEQFSVHQLQNAVADALKCDISSIHDSTVRAETLSETFGNLGRSVIFLDAVPKADFCLKQVGIPEGDWCKLVLTTRFDSVSEMLGCSGVVRLGCLPDEEALELFLHGARLEFGSVSLLENLPLSLVNECHGVPSKIVDVAKRMSGIPDIRELRNTLFELKTAAFLQSVTDNFVT